MQHPIARTLALALTAVALAASGCGGDDETTADSTSTTEATTTSATSTSASTTTTPASADGGFEAASANLEAAGFELEEKTGEDLVQTVGYSKPITAVAGAVATMPGTSGDILVYEFASEEDAKSFVKVNTDDILQADSVGVIAVSATANNTDQLDEAIAAIGG